MKNTCKMLMALGIGSREVYEEDFEKPLLTESREFYRVSHSYWLLCTCHSLFFDALDREPEVS